MSYLPAILVKIAAKAPTKSISPNDPAKEASGSHPSLLFLKPPAQSDIIELKIMGGNVRITPTKNSSPPSLTPVIH
jgi:hypothetical protein